MGELPVGARRTEPFTFHAGDMLVLYTDGVIEARSPARAFYPLAERVASFAAAGPDDLPRHRTHPLAPPPAAPHPLEKPQRLPLAPHQRHSPMASGGRGTQQAQRMFFTGACGPTSSAQPGQQTHWGQSRPRQASRCNPPDAGAAVPAARRGARVRRRRRCTSPR
jgi:hypothetical protein